VTRPRQLGVLTAIGCAAVALLGLGPAPAPALAPVSCPGFRVLHDDRIGPAVLPAGTYRVTLAPASALTCATASKQLARFLADFDGVLPAPWRVVPGGSGKAAFNQGAKAAFSVAAAAKKGPETPRSASSAAAPSRSTRTRPSARSPSPKAPTSSTSRRVRGLAATAPRSSSPASSAPAAPCPPRGACRTRPPPSSSRQIRRARPSASSRLPAPARPSQAHSARSSGKPGIAPSVRAFAGFRLGFAARGSRHP
jgi:hypothetical protein